MLVSSTRSKLQVRYIRRDRGVILVDVIFGDLGWRRLEAKKLSFWVFRVTDCYRS